MTDSFFNAINDGGKPPSGQYSPLVLAYLGDAVFEMCVRSMIVSKSNAQVNALHKQARSFVNAKAQADMFNKIKDILTEEELLVFKRGRNAKSNTVAKNSKVSDYRHATGMEALFGYLFLKGDNERITELFNKCVKE